MHRYFAVIGFLCFALFAEVAKLNAALVMTATGVYDEQTTQTNSVDLSPSPSVAAGTVNLVSLADFKTKISTAFAGGSAGTGGVITFDDAIPQTTNLMTVTYGGSKTLTVTNPFANFQLDMSASGTIAATTISGANYLRSTSGTHTYQFGTFLNDVGITILGRGANRTVTATIGYSDLTTGVLSPVTIAMGNTNDTFLGFTAPAGKAIVSLTLTPPDPVNDFFVVDDIGFVTSAIPEPSSVALIATLSVGSLWGLRRRFAR